MTTSDIPIFAPTAGRTRRRRLWIVALAVTAAVTAALLIEGVAGVDLRAPVFDGPSSGQDIGPGTVMAASLVASMAAWGLLAVVERYFIRSRRIWTTLAVSGLLVSLGAPLSGRGIAAEGRLVLILLHLIVAAVLIPLLYRTAERPPPADATLAAETLTFPPRDRLEA